LGRKAGRYVALVGVGISGDISHALEVMVLGMSILELWFHEPPPRRRSDPAPFAVDFRAGDSFSRFGIQRSSESVTVALSPGLGELAGLPTGK